MSHDTKRRNRLVVLAVVALAAAAAGSYALHGILVGVKPPSYTPVFRGPTTLMPWDTVGEAGAANGPELPYIVKTGEIRPGDTFGGVMQTLGLSVVVVEKLASIMKGVFSFNKCRPGDAFEVRLDGNGDLLRFEYQVTPVEVYIAELGDDGRFEAYREEFEEEMKVVWVTGRIESSLYETVVAIREDPELAMKIANEVFAWDIDFYTEAQKGDVFKVAVEKHYSGDYFIRYGRILAAEYAGGVGRKQSFWFRDPSGKDGYYNAQGVATKRVFLRSPLKYAHVTSKFGTRFHPILHTFKQHHGVDYGAAIGTPVWAVADGSVVTAGVQGGLGKAVTVRHAGGYTSIYGHLSKIAGIHAGGRVHQGQVIGNVGSTGLSTGPHLHFGLLQNGSYINPVKRVAPPTEPIPARYLAAFKEAIRPWVERLGKVETPDAPVAPAPAVTPAAGTGGFNLWLGASSADG